MKKKAYRSIWTALNNAGKTTHLSPGAVFVRSQDGRSYHEFSLDDYSLSGQNSDLVPRLYINSHRAHKGLPLSVSAKWNVGRRAPSDYLGIEITLMEGEFSKAFARLPQLIDHVEAGHHSGLEAFLPFPSVLISKTNIWSKNADDLARAAHKEREARRQRR